MEGAINQVFLLTPSEIEVLAAAKNIRTMFSLRNEPLQSDEAAVLQAMSHLYQQQFIYNAGYSEFILDAVLEEMLTSILNAKAAFLIRGFTQDAASKSLYVGKRLIVTECSNVDTDMIRLYEVAIEELREFLGEDLEGMKKPYKQVLDEERLMQEAMENPLILQREEISSLSNTAAMVEEVSQKSGRVNIRLLMKQGADNRQLLCYRQQEQRLYTLKEHEWTDRIVGMIEEVFYDNG